MSGLTSAATIWNGEHSRPGCRVRRPRRTHPPMFPARALETAREARALPPIVHPEMNSGKKSVANAECGWRIVESARGLAHSKTLRAHRTVPGFPPGFGLRRPSAAFSHPRRGGIFRSLRTATNVAPERSFGIFAMRFYKDDSPTGFSSTPRATRGR